MKTLLLLVAAVALGFCGAIAAVRWEIGPSTATPELLGLNHTANVGPHATVEVDSILYDAKRVDLNTQPEHVFTFSNTGNAELKLQIGETSCQCTSAIMSTDRVAPGSSAKIKVHWRTDKLEPFRNTVTVLTNDPARPRVILTVIGEVVPTVSIEPQQILLGNIPSISAKHAEARVFSFHEETLAITQIELTDPKTAVYFDVTAIPLPQYEATGADAKSGCLVSVTIKPGLPPGPIRQTIRLTTNLPSNSKLEIPIEGTVATP